VQQAQAVGLAARALTRLSAPSPICKRKRARANVATAHSNGTDSIMKFTLSWLKEHLDTTATLDQICEGLIGVGLEVEEVSDRTQELAAFKVAYVLEAEKHPNADKLRLCKVETDTGVIQVVCGAPNARAGMKAIIALPGAVIPVTKAVLENRKA
jgi:predicted RNA-binding protein with EMAP domain